MHYLCSLLVQTATLKLIQVFVTTINELVYQAVVTENHCSHSLQEGKTVRVSDIVNVLDKAWYHHATAFDQPTALNILRRYHKQMHAHLLKF